RDSGRFNDNYTNLFQLVDALTAPDVTYVPNLPLQLDTDEWINMLAFRHVLGDWDAYGYLGGRNSFIYRSISNRWTMLAGRFTYPLGSVGGHSATADPSQIEPGETSIARIYNEPAFRRIYLRALQRAIDGPLLLTNVQTRFIDPAFQGFQSNAIAATPPSAGG